MADTADTDPVEEQTEEPIEEPIDEQTKANTIANASSLQASGRRGSLALAKDEITLLHEGRRNSLGKELPSPSPKTFSRSHFKMEAVEPTEDKQGTVPPEQERAGYVADSE